MRRAVALLRVSSEAQAGPDRGGLDRQRAAVAEIALRHGLEIVETIALEGVSGASVLADAAFRRMLARLDDPAIAGVVVDDVSRLMRPEKLSDYQILEAFRGAGKLLFTRDGERDVRAFGGRILSLLQGELAAYERQEIARRTREGRERKRRLGIRTEGGGKIGIPIGVAYDRERGWRYVEPGASQIRAAFDALLGGERNFREIARRSGLDRGRAPMGLSRLIATSLRQPLYAGVYRVEKRWHGRGKWTLRPEADRYEVAVLKPPLVSPEEFAEAQAILDARARARTRAPRSEAAAIYHGAIDCAACGAPLWYRSARRGAASIFCGRRRDGRCPEGVDVSVALADPAIDEALEARLGSLETLRALVARAAEETRARRGPGSDAGRRLATLHNRRARVLDGFEGGLYSREEAAKRLAGIDGEIGALEDLLGREEPEAIAIDAATLRRVVRVFAEWRDLEPGEKRRLVKAWRVRVRLAGGGKRRAPVVESIEIGALGESSRNQLRIYK